MTARLIVGLLSVLLLAVSLWSMRLAISGAPAFDPQARIDGVFGQWRVWHAPAHYNRAEYLSQLSEGYLRADAVASEATGGETELASTEVAIQRAQRAEWLLLESLALSPADAHSWTLLSWARAMQGRVDAARETMVVSWALAPNNFDLAQTRLTFAEFLARSALASENSELSPEERAGIRGDFETVFTFAPKRAAAIIAASELISELQGQPR